MSSFPVAVYSLFFLNSSLAPMPTVSEWAARTQGEAMQGV